MDCLLARPHSIPPLSPPSSLPFHLSLFIPSPSSLLSYSIPHISLPLSPSLSPLIFSTKAVLWGMFAAFVLCLCEEYNYEVLRLRKLLKMVLATLSVIVLAVSTVLCARMYVCCTCLSAVQCVMLCVSVFRATVYSCGSARAKLTATSPIPGGHFYL